MNYRTVSSLKEVSLANWNGLAGTVRSNSDTPYCPFNSYAYLSALEESGSATPKTGWAQRHILMEDGRGGLLGAVPAYLKSHSQGEYVFDHGWAQAFERAGGHYYPKLQCALPFTPATACRLLTSTADDRGKIFPALAEAIKAETTSLGISSAHVTFLPEQDLPPLEKLGFLHRTDQQFHFHNEGYANHDEFLETLSSRKRKGLRKERRAALENGIEIDWLTGSDLTENVWDQFFAFYMDTGSRKWGRPYLTRSFFSLIGERMADDILLIMAKHNGRYVAGAINFVGSDTLYGRHWGCVEDHPFLHFEVCYHQAIDFALSKGLKTVEAGAQGEHKLARGYMPVTTHSAHFIAHPGLRRAIDDYLEQERREIEAVGEYLSEHGPFRRGPLQQEHEEE